MCGVREKQHLRRINHTTQGDATEGNKAGGILMVDQGILDDFKR